jgi:peptidoglycan/xylan/chitin deacetylase (PgdA/CDA1 family)
MASSLKSVRQKIIKSSIISVALMGGIILPVAAPIHAYAATTNIAPAAKISFTFDDGYTTAVTQAAPTLAKYGLSGTEYISTGCVGMTKAPNTCRADSDKTYMTWDQINQLKSTYGWEIGSHTVTHPYLATFDATDGQPAPLTPTQVNYELNQSKADLAAHGISAADFATPYGDYNAPVLAQIAKYYATQRGFQDQNHNIWPYSDYLINDMPVQEGVTVAQVEAKIDEAITNKYWLVLTMHDIKAKPSKNIDDYEYGTAELDQIAAYVKAKQTAGTLQAIHIDQGMVKSDTNLLPNGSFNNGVADGWTTDSPTTITKDIGTNGSYPDPTNSVKLVSSASTTHLFSPKVAVSPSTTYVLKNFLSVQQLTSGEVGFYVDEYDGFGNWISGQYKTKENTKFVESMNFAYKPSSAQVVQARLQVVVTGNSGITAYIDNSQWFPVQTATPPPPPPAQTNLIANGTFDNGIANGWMTDSSATVTKDTASNGSPANPVNSVKMVASTKNTHLFSPQVAVDSTKTYSLSTYVNLKQITSGEVGFYIDEYDANGNWISGQYKTGVRSGGTGNVAFQYKPTSASVMKANLQIICTGNSNILVYVDDVQWYLP